MEQEAMKRQKLQSNKTSEKYINQNEKSCLSILCSCLKDIPRIKLFMLTSISWSCGLYVLCCGS